MIWLIIIRNVHGRVIKKEHAPSINDVARIVSTYISEPEVFQIQFLKVKL